MSRRRGWRLVNLVAALLVAAAVLFVSAAGAGPLPPLGTAFNPGSGVWTTATDARLPLDSTLRLPGLRHPVRVTFEGNGVAHLEAEDDLDLFEAQGYLHGVFRLFEMDLIRRQAGGRLSEVIGPATVDVDRFELELGLDRTAREEWRQADSEVRAIVEAYTRGVNARIRQDRDQHSFPAMFRMLGYEPRDWTPVDTMLVKGYMTQYLDFQTAPLDHALLADAVGKERALEWLPLLPPNQQSPYDPGPYPKQATVATIDSLPTTAAMPAQAAVALERRLRAMPLDVVARGGNSNNWAIDGTKSADGKPILAGDPHLSLTLPAIWFEVSGDSPGYHFRGVGIPGTPAVIIGRNRHIAWSLTNGQNQATIYYREKTDPAHPGQYFWQGAWRGFQKVAYDIPVKGAATVRGVVNVGVHGPVMTQEGQTLAVYWVGGIPSPDLGVISKVVRASDFAGFRDALRGWHAPSQNFVYADDAGHIGMVSAGFYPVVKAGDPWLPLPGTGEYDVVGTIPFDQVPQVYDPPTHYVVSANQRQVGPDFPWYIGTASNSFDPGHRANEISRVLGAAGKMTPSDIAGLQGDNRDELAARIAPRLLEALSTATLNGEEKAAAGSLRGWDGQMLVDSTAAAVWNRFWSAYVRETFQPWWDRYKVKAKIDDLEDGLGQSLEAWTLSDPSNPTFTPPGGSQRTAPAAMVAAFRTAVRALDRELGSDTSTWTWGRVHHRVIASLAHVKALQYGPLPFPGDHFTPNAAPDMESSHGPSWRMIVDFGGASLGVYPGGQSENPVSAWYENGIPDWWQVRNRPLSDAAEARSQPGIATWTLRP